eukprot:304605-Pyramimonas_sp.AAC.1
MPCCAAVGRLLAPSTVAVARGAPPEGSGHGGGPGLPAHPDCCSAPSLPPPSPAPECRREVA